MASNHISIASATTIGANVNGAISSLRSSIDQVHRMYHIMSEFADGLTALAAELGTNETDATTVRSNFQNALTVLEGADIQYMINRLGQ